MLSANNSQSRLNATSSSNALEAGSNPNATANATQSTTSPAVSSQTAAAAAAAAATNQGESQQQHRQSYLDVIKESMPGGGGGGSGSGFLYLAIVVGQFQKNLDAASNDHQRSEYSSHYQRLFKKLQTEATSTTPQDNKITGILLLFPKCFIHVLEGPQKSIYAFLADVEELNKGIVPVITTTSTVVVEGSQSSLSGTVAASATAGSGVAKKLTMGEARLLTLQDDIPKRNFPFWASKVIDSKDNSSDALPVDWNVMESQAIDEAVSSVCIQLIGIGTSLSAMNKNEMKQAFEDITDRFRTSLPSPAQTLDLANNSQVLSVSDWCREFGTGWMRVGGLEGEVTWPVERPPFLS